MAILLLTVEALWIIIRQNVTGPLRDHIGVSCIASREGKAKKRTPLKLPFLTGKRTSVRKLCVGLSKQPP